MSEWRDKQVKDLGEIITVTLPLENVLLNWE